MGVSQTPDWGSNPHRVKASLGLYQFLVLQVRLNTDEQCSLTTLKGQGGKTRLHRRSPITKCCDDVGESPAIAFIRQTWETQPSCRARGEPPSVEHRRVG